MLYFGLFINFKKEMRVFTVSVIFIKPTYAPGEQVMVVVNVCDVEGNLVVGVVLGESRVLLEFPRWRIS
jgi:hypothetical protein